MKAHRVRKLNELCKKKKNNIKDLTIIFLLIGYKVEIKYFIQVWDADQFVSIICLVLRNVALVLMGGRISGAMPIAIHIQF